METDFIYWRHPTLPGIKIEEICGGEDKEGKLWLEMAYQLYCENGKDGYRELGHYQNGAPFLFGEESRISISHTKGFLVIATLPATPEVDLAQFSLRAAMGVDAEAEDRTQVLRVRDKFLSELEQGMIAADDVEKNVLAWTVKEACYKALMQEGLDFKEDIMIEELPGFSPAVPVYDKKEFPEIRYGRALCRVGMDEERQSRDRKQLRADETESLEQKQLRTDEDNMIELTLFSYRSEGRIVTLAYSPKCAKFAKRG